MKYYEVTAKMGDNIDEMFHDMVLSVLEKWKNNPRSYMLTTIVN